MTNSFRRLLHRWFGVSPARTIHNPRKRRAKRATTFRPSLETLEDRVVPTSTYYLVTTLGDGDASFSGQGSGTQADPFQFNTLLGAVINANGSHPGTDTITFSPSLFTSGAQTINLSTIEQDLSSTEGATDLAIYTDITIMGPTGIGPSGEYASRSIIPPPDSGCSTLHRRPA
jgi:hypothetical protein